MSFKLVVNYFELVSSSETKKEIIRQMIAEFYDPLVQLSNIQQIIQEYNSDLDILKLEYLLSSQYDSINDMIFLDYILPYKIKSLKNISENKHIPILLHLIDSLIEFHYETETQLANIKQQINKITKDVIVLYREVDPQESGFIDTIKLNKFLSQLGFYTTTDDLIKIFRKLDKDQDGYISLVEFLNEFQFNFQQDEISTQTQTPERKKISRIIQENESLYSSDCLLLIKLMMNYIEQIDQLPNITPLEYIEAYKEMKLDENDINKYRRVWNINEECLQCFETNDTIKQLIKGSIEVYKECYRLKREFIKQKQQSYLNIFQNLTQNEILEKQDFQNVCQYFQIQFDNQQIEQILKLFNREEPMIIEFKHFLNFFNL